MKSINAYTNVFQFIINYCNNLKSFELKKPYVVKFTSKVILWYLFIVWGEIHRATKKNQSGYEKKFLQLLKIIKQKKINKSAHYKILHERWTMILNDQVLQYNLSIFIQYAVIFDWIHVQLNYNIMSTTFEQTLTCLQIL